MSINFQEILKELEYRVEHGIIDLTKEEQVTKLVEILRENGVSDANEMAQKARVYFSYLNEDDVVKNKKTGNVYMVKNFDAKKHDKPTPDEIEKAKKANGGKLPTTDKPTSGKPAPKVGAQKAAPAANIGVSDAEKNADAKAAKGRNPQEIKKEIDRISIQSGQSRDSFYKKGYHKSESDEDAGSAPGNAGSMLNENGSCDVAEWALENDKDDLVSAVSHLYDNLKGGALLEATDKTGIAGQDKSVPSVNAKQLRDFRAAGKGKFDKLSDGQLSRLMMAANGGLIKARKIREGIKANGWKEEDCTVNGFFGDEGGKSQQMDMIKQSNRIFGPDGTEIPKDVALKLTAAGGGGANPSDTSQFVYNSKTGDLMIKFTSDKDSFDAIVAQSSFQKEGQNKKIEIDKLVKDGRMKPADGERLKKVIDKQTASLNKIENELKSVVAEPAKALSKKNPKELSKVAMGLSTSNSGRARMAAIEKKYGKLPQGMTNLMKVAQSDPESLSSGDRRVVDDLKNHYGLDYLVADKIDNIRKRSVAVERKLLNEMDKVPVKLSDGSKVGLGTYLDAQNFIEKFHMGGALGDKHGVFAYKGLFEVVCGVGVINDDIISSCMNTNNPNDFIKKFGSTAETFQKSKENQITGSVRVAYFLNDKKQKINIGEKRQRSKTGATGRFNTVYKWDKDTIECFKRKNGVA
jgi:hypothetical protein